MAHNIENGQCFSNLQLVTSGTALTQLPDTTHKLPLRSQLNTDVTIVEIKSHFVDSIDCDYQVFVDIFIYNVTDNK